MDTVDITNLSWEPAPRIFDTEHNGQITNVFSGKMTGFGNHGDMIMHTGFESKRSSISLNIHGKWYFTDLTRDWPQFDQVFGRDAWQEFLKEFEQECQKELEALEEEE